MTERLSTLLRDEAADLLPPPPPTADILGTGRRLRRRRRTAQVVGGSALAAVLVVGAVFATTSLHDDAAGGGEGKGIDPATAAYLDHGAFATGTTVHLGDGGNVDVGEKVKVVYYTSAGLLVRSGDTPWTDDPGPSHYSLVAPDGTTTRLDLDLGDRVPATDPDQPVVAYADAAGPGSDSWDIVVRDVTTDREVSRTTVQGSFTWGGWEAPPVELDGDLVYVGLDAETPAVDWRTGTVTSTSLGSSTVPEVAGGHVVTSTKSTVEVVDLATGRSVYSTPNDGYPYISLSPDGRYAKVVQQDESEGDSFDVVDLRSGDTTTIDGASWDFGWSPAGNLVSVDLKAGELSTCTAGGGDCSTSPVSGPVKGELKLAGISYES
ncbi:hypothetical protein ABLE68_02050 [Nocardioides sp. CN2-186]|uniref:hypothetical protein n=1 Tax=Nocardioides tweenelious TaxID=3156607 RepID=UPI0032B5BFB7